MNTVAFAQNGPVAPAGWRPRLVLFDYGNVMAWFDNRRFIRRLLAGSPRDPEVAWRQLYAHTALASEFERGELDEAVFRQRVCDILGIPLDCALFDEAFAGIFVRSEVMTALVEWLAPRCRIGLLSNTNALHERLEIRTNPALRWFNQLTMSHRVGAMKPDPAIYHDAIAQAGMAPEHILYLDDIPDYVAEGRRQHLWAWQVTDHDKIAARVRALWS